MECAEIMMALDYVSKYHDMAFSLIPNKPQTKKPDFGEGEYKPYYYKVCDVEIKPHHNVGVMLGKPSNNLIAFDDDTYAETFLDLFPEYREKTFCTKSGQKGGAIFFRMMDLPEACNLTKDGKTIQLFTKERQIILPPSIHPETKKHYEILHDNQVYDLTKEEFRNIINKLNANGFEIEKTKVTNAEGKSIRRKSTKELLESDWGIGERYDNFRDLALRRFHEGMTDEQVRDEAYSKNKTLSQCHDLDEVDRAIDAGFSLYQTNLANPQNGYFEKKEVTSSGGITKRNSKDKGVIDSISKDVKEKYTFVTLSDTNEILLHNGKIYSKAEAESLIKKETEDRITDCTTHDRNEVVNKIKAQTYTNLKDFDADTNLVTLENGILNLETLEKMDHNSSYLSRVLLPVEYHKPIFEINDDTIFEDIEKNLKDTLFWQFLQRSFMVNGEFRKDDFETVLEIIASPIIKRHIDEKAFMFLGSGENGKSVCLDYIKSMIGNDNISRVTLQQIADNKFMVAQLAGKSANIFTDLESGELKHAGKIKAITSGEGLEAEEKYMSPFTLYPFAKLMFSCNRFPKVYDQSHAFFRRWMIVKWERNFEKDPERIEYLRERLSDNQEEKNKVFSCLVYLARKLNKVGKFSHTKDSKIIQKEWNENADPIDWFDTNYIKESEGNKSKIDTYRFYKKVMLSKGEASLGMGQFSKAFAEYHDELITKEGRTQRVWLNIDFDDNILELSDST